MLGQSIYLGVDHVTETDNLRNEHFPIVQVSPKTILLLIC